MQILPIWSKSCSATGARDNGRCVLGTRNPANTEQDSTRLTSQYTLWCSLLIIAFSAHCWWQSAAAVTIWYMLNAFIAQAAPSAEAYLLPQPCLESHTHTWSQSLHIWECGRMRFSWLLIILLRIQQESSSGIRFSRTFWNKTIQDYCCGGNSFWMEKSFKCKLDMWFWHFWDSTEYTWFYQQQLPLTPWCFSQGRFF